MSLGLHDRRHRNRFWSGVTRIGFYLLTLAGVGLFAYQTGVEWERRQQEAADDLVSELETANAELLQDAIEAKAEAQTAQARHDLLLQQLSEIEVPDERHKYFHELVSRSLDDGVDPQRLGLYIAAASRPLDCDGPTTKRFILPTSAGRTDNTSAGFADGQITVSGRGTAARGADGTIRDWFDPAQEVTIEFRPQGGEPEMVTGVLPLTHSMLLGHAEHRFTVVAGDRSFVQVTAEACGFS